MTYIEGFVTPVPNTAKDAYIAHATRSLDLLRDFGAARLVENWADDVQHGTTTDFFRTVQAKDDETVTFSWIEYPDKAARDAANAKMMDDPRMEEMGKDLPFDGLRMVYGGFQAIVERNGPGVAGYVDGYVLPVPAANKEAYRAMAEKVADKFVSYGAIRVIEGWEDDVPDGKVTDYRRAVLANQDERIVYSYVTWPDKATRDAGWAQLMDDPEMQNTDTPPFDGKRMFWGGFTPILDQ